MSSPNPPPYTPCAYYPVVYGDYVFTGYTKTSLNSQNVYSDDGLTLKWVKHTLEVEFIISQELCHYTGNQPTSGVDVEIDAIREALLEPYRQLEFWYHGAGIKLTVQGKLNETTQGNLVQVPGFVEESPYYINYNLLDGPFPEVLSWEPIGLNNAVTCRWRVVFNLPVNERFMQGSKIKYTDLYNARHRTNSSVSGPLDQLKLILDTVLTAHNLTSADYQGLPEYFLASFTEEQEINIEDDGTTTMSFIGVMEFTSSGASFIAAKGEKTVVPILLQAMCAYFEPYHPVGFTRSQKYRYRKSRREIEFVITDKEIKSESPLLPNIITADVSHSVSSDLLGDDVLAGTGFLTWKNTFEGTIKVRPGVWKGWAWIAMMTLVLQRIRRTSTIAGAGEDPAALKDEVDSAKKLTDQVNANDKVLKPRHLMTSVRIVEKIYSREVSFEISYMVMSSLSKLFENTGLFYPAHILWQNVDNIFFQNPFDSTSWGKVPNNPRTAPTGTPREEWSFYNEDLTSAQNVFGYRGPLLSHYHMLFNPYDVDNHNSAFINDAKRTPEQSLDVWGNFSRNIPMATYGNNSNNVDQFALRRRLPIATSFPSNWSLLDPDIAAAVELKKLADPSKTPGEDEKSANQIPVYPGATENTANWMAISDPSRTWISYSPNFELIRNHNSVMMPSIKSKNPDTLHNSNIYPIETSKAYTGFTILGQSTAEQSETGMPSGSDMSRYIHDNVQVFGEPTTFIRFYGSAVRAGYPIPTPTLVGANAMNGTSQSLVRAYLVGTSTWKHSQLSDSVDIPIFGATWDMLYALKGDPVCANITFQTQNTSSRYL